MGDQAGGELRVPILLAECEPDAALRFSWRKLLSFMGPGLLMSIA